MKAKVNGRDRVSAACSFLFLCCAALLVACSSREMTATKFKKLPPFQGRVTKIEPLPWKRDFHPSTMCGPDYRVTISPSNDSTIVIPRFHTLVTSTLGGFENLTIQPVSKLPEDLTRYEHKHGD
jgi:hypothetical protein